MSEKREPYEAGDGSYYDQKYDLLDAIRKEAGDLSNARLLNVLRFVRQQLVEQSRGRLRSE
jgi:hypothetical protein